MTKKNKNLLEVGYVSKAHGIKGEIFVRTFNDNPDWPQLKTLFIGTQLNLPPLTIESYRPHKQGWIFKLKDIKNINESEKFIGKPVFFLQNQFKSKKGETFYLSEIKGFLVKTKNKSLGSIKSFYLNKTQDLICIKNNQKEFFIPLVSEYIVKVQFDKKQLELCLPPRFLEEFCD